MARRAALRASDADREHIAERLRQAAAEGRLRADEFEQRLEVTLTARTYGELHAVIADLPGPRPVAVSGRRIPVRLRPATVAVLLILFPMALAIAVAAFVAVLALVTAWSIAVALAGLFLGPRARGLRGPWAVGCHAWRVRRSQRQIEGSFTPWR